MKNDFTNILNKVIEISRNKYDIDVGNNAIYVMEKLFLLSKENQSISYAECGVYKGTTLLPIYHFCNLVFNKFKLFAIDSYAGFPKNIQHVNDDFKRFYDLHQDSKISIEHLNRAENRYKKLKADEHLTTEYFSNYFDELSARCKDKNEIKIIKCDFSDLNEKLFESEYFNIVFLDCDLYQSYKTCLDFFHDKTSLFVFDEYYSLKYPGGRIAVDGFISKNVEWQLENKIEHNPYFERWSMIKTNGK